MTKVISIINQKGGTGKTTTSQNFAFVLSEILKYKVLLIDLDPQGNLSTCLGLDKQSFDKSNIYHAILEPKKMNEVIYKTKYNHLFLAPSNNDLSAINVEIINEISREKKLKMAIKNLTFDYIIIDCPPSLNLLTINALTASDEVIVPLQAEYLPLEGLAQLINIVDLVKDNLNENLIINGVLVTMFKQTKLHEEVVHYLRKNMTYKIYENVIPSTIKVAESQSRQQNVIDFDFKNPASIAYLGFVEEYLGRSIYLDVLSYKGEL